MSIESRLEAIVAAPKPWLVRTVYVDGNVREFRAPREGMARNHAAMLSRKIGRELIDRETGAVVRVAAVTVEHSPE